MSKLTDNIYTAYALWNNPSLYPKVDLPLFRLGIKHPIYT